MIGPNLKAMRISPGDARWRRLNDLIGARLRRVCESAHGEAGQTKWQSVECISGAINAPAGSETLNISFPKKEWSLELENGFAEGLGKSSAK